MIANRNNVPLNQFYTSSKSSSCSAWISSNFIDRLPLSIRWSGAAHIIRRCSVGEGTTGGVLRKHILHFVRAIFSIIFIIELFYICDYTVSSARLLVNHGKNARKINKKCDDLISVILCVKPVTVYLNPYVVSPFPPKNETDKNCIIFLYFYVI